MLTKVMSSLCLSILNINKEARKQVWFVNTGDVYSTWSVNKKALWECEFDLFIRGDAHPLLKYLKYKLGYTLRKWVGFESHPLFKYLKHKHEGTCGKC